MSPAAWVGRIMANAFLRTGEGDLAGPLAPFHACHFMPGITSLLEAKGAGVVALVSNSSRICLGRRRRPGVGRGRGRCRGRGRPRSKPSPGHRRGSGGRGNPRQCPARGKRGRRHHQGAAQGPLRRRAPRLESWPPRSGSCAWGAAPGGSCDDVLSSMFLVEGDLRTLRGPTRPTRRLRHDQPPAPGQ